MERKRILVIGAAGQIGVELVEALRADTLNDVIATDIHEEAPKNQVDGTYERLDVQDKTRLEEVVGRYGITDVYLLAAMLSATAEKNPVKAWALNMEGLLNVLELARTGKINKVFWPSSIAVFGPTSPQKNTPQSCIMEPTSVYGISKLAGERWCEYYFNRYGVDVRSLRYPGLISWNSPPGGGTTDYAVDIFHHAIKNGNYTCFLSKDTYLPMMHMGDAVRATLELMKTPAEQIKIRSSYNLASMSFSPAEIAKQIQKIMPEFKISYAPDFRQSIADSWPDSISDESARADWNWAHEHNIETLVEDMMYKLQKIKEIA